MPEGFSLALVPVFRHQAEHINSALFASARSALERVDVMAPLRVE